MTPQLEPLELLLYRTGSKFCRMQLGEGVTLLVTDLGGRVFGPFLDGVDPLGWIPSSLGSLEEFQALRDRRDWNIGGERLWISPELVYFAKDRKRFWDTFSVPTAIDPGHYRLEARDRRVSLSQSIALHSQQKDTEIRRTLSVLVHPPVVPSNHVRCAGYRQEVSITRKLASEPAVPWILRQTSAGGLAIVPVDSGAEAITMFGNPVEPVRRGREGAVRMPVTCESLYKIGIPAASAHGIVGYVRTVGETSFLMISQFNHDRRGTFYDEPPDSPGVSGMSTFLFQDDGTFGNYCELEIVGADLGVGPDGTRRGFLSVDSWIYAGPREAVDKLAEDLRVFLVS